jgi:PAS domain S-box-containing protein
LLPLILGMTAVYATLASTSVGRLALTATFICVVLFSVSSSRTWHAYLTATLGSILAGVQYSFHQPHVHSLAEAITRDVTLAIVLVSFWVAAWLGTRLVNAARLDSAQRSKAETLGEMSLNQQQTLEQLKLAAETAGLWLWERKPNGEGEWDLNRPKGFGMEAMSNADAKQFFFNCIDPDDLAEMRTAIEQAMTSGQETLSAQHRAHAPDGSLHYFQVKIRIMRDASHQPIRLLGATQNVTENVTRAQLLEAQVSKERLAYERMHIAAQSAGLWIWERDAKTLELLWDDNRPPELGAPTDPLNEVATRLRSIILPEDLQRMHAQRGTAIDQRANTNTVRFRVRLPETGEIRHRETFTHIDYDRQGQAVKLTGITRDITADMQKNETIELKAQHNYELSTRLNAAIETAGMHCWQLRFLGTGRVPELVWSLNSAAEFGSGTEQLITPQPGNVLLHGIHPDDLPKFEQDFQEALQQQLATNTVLYRRLHSDGKYHHFRADHRCHFHADGTPDYVIGTCMDVTSRVETFAQIEQQKHELETLNARIERAAESSREGHWEVDLATRTHWVSSNYLALLGYPPDYDVSSNEKFRALVHPDDILNDQEMHKRYYSNDHFEVVRRFKHANGEWRWMQSNGACQRDADGKPVRLTGSLRDIHEQKIAEEKLLEAQQRLNRAINGTSDGLWEIDLSKPERPYWASPNYMKILGYEPVEVTYASGDELDSFIHPDDLPRVRKFREQSIMSNGVLDIEYRIRRLDQCYIWVHVRGTLDRDVNGKPIRAAGSLSDVTAAHETRQQLIRASEEAQAANLAKSAFLANMSHEIRTPMNGIIGMTGLLLDSDLDSIQRDFAETVRSSADSLLSIINDILDFSKIEAGKLDIEMLEMDLRSNVEDVGAMLGLQAASKNLELIINVHPDIPERVIGDPQRIRQCLVNLLGNAIKFTRQGQVVIQVSHYGQRDDKLNLLFEVQDTGIGLSEAGMAKLFQPFSQADTSTTRKFGGTGLGLSIVKRLVELMGGQIGVKSKVGQGSIFWFTLPLGITQVQSTAAEPLANHNGKRVLIVDDNETNRQVLSLQLQHCGYAVDVASGGDQALEALRNQSASGKTFDVVLADFQMPDMDGAMLGERINADPSLSRLRLILLTSMDRHGDAPRFAAMGFAAYLTKPIRARELRECLERVLSRSAEEWRQQRRPLLTRNAIKEQVAAQRYEGKVLLVDDNLVNQKVAGRLLERMGVTVVMANDGAEAVTLYQAGGYDLVFMDLQMPVMDGFEATRRIRDFEAWRPRTAIIALTANAMVGQLERCLASGMDGFLSKPIQVELLRDAVAKYCRMQSSDSPAQFEDQTAADILATPAADHSAIFNISKLRAIAENDVAFMRELAQAYLDSSRDSLREMQAAITADDRLALSRAAHKLKGASANIYAERIRDQSAYLEKNAAILSIEVLSIHITGLQQALNDVSAELSSLIQDDQSAA